ncbi:MAG: amidophosphoribosyltransferase [Candidatus Methanomethylicia archaeon]
MCGIAALSLKSCNAIPKVIKMLLALQHRGQESTGIAFINSSLNVYKGFGLVPDVFRHVDITELNSSTAIGHVRYSTTGSRRSIYEVQPFLLNVSNKSFSIAFNGNIVNHHYIRREILKNSTFKTETDTETIGLLIARSLVDEGFDYVEALRSSMSILDGAYSLTLLTSDGYIVAARDPYGFKPLSYGIVDNGFTIASESIAIECIDGICIGDVQPGEVLVIANGEVVERIQAYPPLRRAMCMFEFVYFSRPDSIINGKLIHEVRKNLGRALYRANPIKADFTAPIPDSGRSSALGFAEESGIPFEEVIMKNRYIGRTFILPESDARRNAVELKFHIVRRLVENRGVVVVDDSIVRGVTLTRIIPLMKAKGCREVHVRIACPPILYPCFMGIDFPTERELIASRHSVEEIREIINADTLIYNTVEDLCRGIGCSSEDLCLACLTGKYPLRSSYNYDELQSLFRG